MKRNQLALPGQRHLAYEEIHDRALPINYYRYFIALFSRHFQYITPMKIAHGNVLFFRQSLRQSSLLVPAISNRMEWI